MTLTRETPAVPALNAMLLFGLIRRAPWRSIGETTVAVAPLLVLLYDRWIYLRLEPGNRTVHNDLGHIAWQRGRLAEAIRHYEASLRSEPGNEAAQAALARLRGH